MPDRAAAIARFIRTRLAEQERQADLFHELGCPYADTPAGSPGTGQQCGCPARARLLRDVMLKREVVHDCEQVIGTSGPQAPDWPRDVVFARQLLGALALDGETRPGWREEWRP